MGGPAAQPRPSTAAYAGITALVVARFALHRLYARDDVAIDHPTTHDLVWSSTA